MFKELKHEKSLATTVGYNNPNKLQQWLYKILNIISYSKLNVTETFSRLQFIMYFIII